MTDLITEARELCEKSTNNKFTLWFYRDVVTERIIPELCDALEKAAEKNDELIRELSELARESGCVYCINCPEKITAKKERYSHATETGIAYDNIKVNFCPNCGARMEVNK